MAGRVVLATIDGDAIEAVLAATGTLEPNWWVLDATPGRLPWPSSTGESALELVLTDSTEDLLVLVTPNLPARLLSQIERVSGSLEHADLCGHDSAAEDLLAFLAASPPPPRGVPEVVVVSYEEAEEVLVRVFVQAGLAPGRARVTARDLIDAEAAGYPSHGIGRAPEYVTKLRQRVYRPDGVPKHVHLGPGRSVVDGDNAIGSIVWRHVLDDVLRPSDEPVHVVGIRRAGHLGRLGRLGESVAALDRLVLGFANGAGGGQKVAPHGGAEARLATNPILFACPVPGGRPLVVDISTSSWSDGRVREASATGRSLPSGVLHDEHGHSVRLPGRFTARPPLAALAPLGGTEAHKGFGLALAVEVLAGILCGPDFVQPGKLSSGNSALFIAIRLDSLGRDAAAVRRDLARLAAYICSCPPANPAAPVRLPGTGGTRGSGRSLRVRASTWETLIALAS